MRACLLALLVAVSCATGPVRAQETGAEIRSVISEQIDAFRADDFGAAFDFASPTIQLMFRTPEVFGRMVREGYPMVWRPADVTFSGLRQQDGRQVQGVLVTDGAGRLHMLDYEMIEHVGGWRINGVRLCDAGA